MITIIIVIIIVVVVVVIIVIIVIVIIIIVIVITIIIITQGLSLMLACLSPSLQCAMQVKVSKQQGTAVTALMWTSWAWKSMTMLTVNQLC